MIMKKVSPFNPKKFINHFGFLGRGFLSAGISITILGIIFGIFAPEENVQGHIFKMMYLHVPSSFFAMSIYIVMGICSLLFIIYKIPVLYFVSSVLSKIGAILCAISLISGSIWGRFTWGTFWVWDARVVSMFILFLLYLGYVFCDMYTDDKIKKIATSVLTVLGLLNIPIIKFSVEFYNTLHQKPTIFALKKPSIDFEMLFPLIIIMIGISMCISYTVFLSVKKRIKKQKSISKRTRVLVQYA